MRRLLLGVVVLLVLGCSIRTDAPPNLIIQVYSDEQTPFSYRADIVSDTGSHAVGFPIEDQGVTPWSRDVHIPPGQTVSLSLRATSARGVLLGCRIIVNGVEVDGIFTQSGRAVCLWTGKPS